jgi:hypothetical protein
MVAWRRERKMKMKAKKRNRNSQSDIGEEMVMKNIEKWR